MDRKFAALLLLAAACGGGGTSGPSTPTSLVVKSGDNQLGQAGSVLSAKVVVEARDAKGTVSGVTIAAGVESPGGGSVSPSSATTAADGTVQFTWTLGPKQGTQTLSISTTGASPLHTSSTAQVGPGAATIITATSETSLLVVVSHGVTPLPAVRVSDNFDNPIAGATVTFEALNAGSTLTGATQTTDANGRATLGGWTIGPDAAVYSIRGKLANGAAALFDARGIPNSFTAFAGIGQTANAGTAIPVLPAVRALREDGTPLPNVPVSFAVISGGGSVTGASVVTAADGTARPGAWILGSTPGANHLEASTFGRAPVGFDATGIVGVPATATATAGTTLSGFFGNFLAGFPEVTVKDAGGNPVAAVAVQFAVTAGGGTLSRASSVTDALGKAALGSWRLGPSGAQTVAATVTGLGAPVNFAASATDPPATSTLRIEVRYNTTCATCITPTAEHRAAFDAAVARWTQLLLGGGAPYPIKPSEVDPSCGSINGTVDGVIITAQLDSIDGVKAGGDILGAAGPCVLRDDGFLPVTGLMHFDKYNLPALQSSGALNLVILHEMAHVLGFGTIWNFNVPGSFGYDPNFGTNLFLVGTSTSDPTFNGPGARAAFLGALGPTSSFSGVPVPVEATGGPGTALSHWRDNGSFNNELMTGFLSSGLNPLSAVTVGQFRDLGYLANDASADSYTFPLVIQLAGQPSLALVEGQLPGFITVINRQGRAVARIPRVYR